MDATPPTEVVKAGYYMTSPIETARMYYVDQTVGRFLVIKRDARTRGSQRRRVSSFFRAGSRN
jgi:hypothetical protein